MMRVNKTALMLCAAAATLTLGGCGKKVGGQVVAVVNNEEITQGEVNAALQGQNIPPNVDRKKVMAQIVQQIVSRKLLVGKAKAQGLDKSPSYLAQVQNAEDTVLINMLATNTAKTISVPDAAATDAFMAQNPTLFEGRKRFHLDQIAFVPTPDAALAAKLKAAKTMDDITSALTAAGVQYKKGTGALDTATIPPGVAKQIAALPAGQPFLVPQNGQVIANVITSSEAMPVPAEQARPAALELMRRQQVEEAMRKQVETARASAKITYAPGFAPLANAAAPAHP